MIKKSTTQLVLALAAGGLLAGCAAAPNTGPVGSNPTGVSPQLVKAPPEFKDCVWWNSGSFKEVPEQMAAAGEQYCSSMNTENAQYKATGYHAFARDTNGYPIKGGAYYCVAQ
jgi:hypothetical protein